MTDTIHKHQRDRIDEIATLIDDALAKKFGARECFVEELMALAREHNSLRDEYRRLRTKADLYDQYMVEKYGPGGLNSDDTLDGE